MTNGKEINLKLITRVTTVVFSVLCLAILSGTAWFILSIISNAAGTETTPGEEAVIERLNEPLLNAAVRRLEDKVTAPATIPEDLRNAFFTIKLVVPSPPEPAPPAIEEPAPSPQPAP